MDMAYGYSFLITQHLLAVEKDNYNSDDDAIDAFKEEEYDSYENQRLIREAEEREAEEELERNRRAFLEDLLVTNTLIEMGYGSEEAIEYVMHKAGVYR